MSAERLIFVLSITSIFGFSKSQEWRFPDDFEFGVATSAYQIEGAWKEDGKGANIWDYVGHNRSELVDDGSNGDIACDSYHKWAEDVELIKKLGVNFYRLSLSWSRIFPEGTINKINQPGVDYYNHLIDELQKNGIEVILTLYHWDLPLKFATLGGWTNPIVIPHFARYVRKAYEFFGDRVKTWITINEPRLICQVFKGLVGDITPNFPHGIAEYLCSHNIIKAHAEAYHIYDREFRQKQKGKISITLDVSWYEPFNASNPEDIKAADQKVQFEFGLYANPIIDLNYPKVVIDRVAFRSKSEGYLESRLPKFTTAEKLKIRGTYDFLGINHYITRYAKANEESSFNTTSFENDSGGETIIDPKWESCAAPWIKVVPWGLRNLLKYIKKRYNNPEIIITENGYANAGDMFEDDRRINYLRSYLNATLEAILEDKVNVKAYTAWSLMDNYEWTYGYTLKFGLYHVNFTDPNRTRTPKKSAAYYTKVIRERTV